MKKMLFGLLCIFGGFIAGFGIVCALPTFMKLKFDGDIFWLVLALLPPVIIYPIFFGVHFKRRGVNHGEVSMPATLIAALPAVIGVLALSILGQMLADLNQALSVSWIIVAVFTCFGTLISFIKFRTFN